MSKSEIEISKRKFYTIITIAIIILAAIFIFTINYMQERKEINNIPEESLPGQNLKQHTSEEIQDYKIALYEAILCQYSCPLTEGRIQDTPIVVPEPSCTQACSSKLRANGYSPDQFTEEELLNDSLLSDLEETISNCRTTSGVAEEKTVDNVRGFFDCTSPNLKKLKETYEYLN